MGMLGHSEYASFLNKWPVMGAGLIYFAIVFGLGFLLGAIRVPFIVPRLGTRKAELLEMPFMLLGIVLASQFVLKKFVLPNTTSAYLAVGIVALSLVLIAEAMLFLWLQKQSIRQYIKSRDAISGSVYVLLLIIFALMPLILMQTRR